MRFEHSGCSQKGHARMTKEIAKRKRKTKQERGIAPLPNGLEHEARLTLPQVSTLTGWGRTKIYAEIKAERFPEPERSGSRCSRWRAATVIAAMTGGGT
jgi:predicted DNA-binding transcriptional regulator AlpA